MGCLEQITKRCSGRIGITFIPHASFHCPHEPLIESVSDSASSWRFKGLRSTLIVC